ncbi:MAG: queuosine precursor transporter [Bacteroidia bacterium]|nr:queuosine precursor transporter [Bacteroidia bacterium]
MNNSTNFSKGQLLFIVLGGFFVTNALIAEFIGVKLFSFERSLGFEPVNWTFFGVPDRSFTMTAGVILWPVVFIMTDIINEYFGRKGVRLLSYLTVVLITYAYLMVFLAIKVVPADFWLDINADIKPDINVAFQRVFGQGLWIIIGSLVAFLVGQIVDVVVFQRLRKWTGEKKIWVRATGSTMVSQLIDSFIVLFIAFYIGPKPELKWSMAMVFSTGTVNYLYKVGMAILLTPLLYLIHYGIDSYLGKELSAKMIKQASDDTLS